MPDTMIDCIGADGTFTDEFASTALAGLGEGYQDSKYLDDVHDLPSLIKRGIDTKRDNTKMSEAAKTALIRPPETATDQEKADYQKRLATESGATGKIADYKYGKPDDLPEGVPYNEAGDKELAEFCCNNNVPVAVYEKMRQVAMDNAIQAYNIHTQDEKDAFTAAAKAITDKHQPGDIVEMGRHAFRYIDTWGSDEAKDIVKGALTGEKDVNGNIVNGPDGKPKRHVSMYEIPENLEEWNRRGIPPAQVVHMATVAEGMKAGVSGAGGLAAGAGTPEEKAEQAEKTFIAKCNAQTEDFKPKE